MRFEDRVKALFDSVVSHPAPDWERLIEESTHEPNVKAEVRRLLEFHAKTTGFLSKPAVEAFSSMVRSVGSRIGEFTLIREIGRGGMGIVYLAEDSVLGRTVALKILASQALSSEHDVARFRTEAKAAARLTHPGIVPVYRYGEQDGTHYIVMEYVEGETLAERLERMLRERAPRQAPNEAAPERSGAGRSKEDSRDLANKRHIMDVLKVLASVADALDYAHQNKVIHRDVKPSNILLTKPGEPRLTDFGVAKIGTDQSITVTGEMAGTYYYMSPEQARAQHAQVDHRTDIFSLGVVLYECLTFRRPFTGESSHQVLQALTSTDPPPVRHLNPSVSRDLATVCHKALEKKPADRYPTAGHFAAELRCCLAGEPILTSPPSLWRRAKKFVRKHRVAALVSAFVTVLLVAGGFGYANWVAHQRTLSAIRVVMGEPGAEAEAWIQRLSEDGELIGPVVSLGALPVVDSRHEAGLYRILVQNDGGEFAEFDDYLQSGRTKSHVVWLRRNAEYRVGMVEFAASEYAYSLKSLSTGVEESRVKVFPTMLIDEAEVSNAEYNEFVEATGHPKPFSWPRSGYDPTIADLPVVGPTHADALAYALWRGKRLPTIHEWMAFAQTPAGRRFPWGDATAPDSTIPTNEMLRELQDYSDEGTIQTYRRRARPVRSGDETRSPRGLYHVYGNVQEVTGTLVSYASLGGPPGTVMVAIARTDWATDSTYGGLSDSGLQHLVKGSHRTGFRCARSLAPTIAARARGVR